MDAKTLQGIVYLVLLLGAGAGLWIIALHRILGRAWRHISALETERAQLARKLDALKRERETRNLDDHELLDELDELTELLSVRSPAAALDGVMEREAAT